MREQQVEKFSRLRSGAVGSLEPFERAPDGHAWSELDAHASAAIEALKGAARDALFPGQITPVDPAVIAAFEFIQSAHPFQTFEALVVDVHARSLNAFPALAAFARSAMVRQRALAIVGMARHRGGAASNGAADEKALTSLESTIAGHLIGSDEHEPAASLLAVDVPVLVARLAAARQRHEDFARSEAERLTAELQAAEKAIADAEASRRQELRQFFAARGSRVFNLSNGRAATGAALAHGADGGAVRDIIGDAFNLASISELDRLRLETEAAEAAVGR